MSDQAARRWSVELVGDVVEGQHRAVLVAHALDRERPLAGVGGDRDIGLGLVAAHELVEVRRNLGQAGPFELALPLRQQRLGRAVDQQDAVLGVERDHARR